MAVQRNRKYESLRWRYTHYYLGLLRACEDYPRVLELYKWYAEPNPFSLGSRMTYTTHAVLPHPFTSDPIMICPVGLATNPLI